MIGNLQVKQHSIHLTSDNCINSPSPISDCRKPELAKFALATFFLAIVWVCALSYMMVWMITVIGFTLNIPDTVMGLTFVAAGVSLPDALGGIAVAK